MPSQLTFTITILVAVLTGANVSATSLTSRSPFIPDGFQSQASDTPVNTVSASQSDLKFKGMYQIEESYYFLIGQSADTAKWIKEGENRDSLVVKEYVAGQNKLLVEYQGEPVWLEMVETSAFLGPNSVNTGRGQVQTARTSRSTSTIRGTGSPTGRSSTRRSFSFPQRSVSSTNLQEGIVSAVPRNSGFSPRSTRRAPPREEIPPGSVPPVPVQDVSNLSTDVPAFIPDMSNLEAPDFVPGN